MKLLAISMPDTAFRPYPDPSNARITGLRLHHGESARRRSLGHRRFRTPWRDILSRQCLGEGTSRFLRFHAALPYGMRIEISSLCGAADGGE